MTGRGRPTSVSVEDAIDATLAEGLDRMTMTGVAARLGVDPSTLYRRVGTRDELLALTVDAAVERTRWPEPTGPWRPYLERSATALWDLFDSTPGLALHLRTAWSLPASLIRQSQTIVAFLVRDCGMTVHHAAVVVDSLADMTADSFLTTRALDGGPGRDDVRLRTVERVREVAHATPAPGLDPDLLVAELRRAVDAADPRGWWREKLDLVLDGVAARLGPDGRVSA